MFAFTQKEIIKLCIDTENSRNEHVELTGMQKINYLTLPLIGGGDGFNNV